MNTKLRFRSVKTRQAFWFLVVALVPLVTAVAILYFQRAEAIRGREFEKLQTVRDLKVRELNSWLDQRLGDLTVAAGDDEIRGLEEVFAKDKSEWTQEDLEAVDVARALLRRYVDTYKAYHEFFLISASDPAVRISTLEAREGLDKSQHPYFIEPLRRKETYFSPIYDSWTEGVPTMGVSAPVYCREHDGQHVFAVLVARIDLEHSLYHLLQEHTGLGRTGETLLVNEDGYALNKLRWDDDAPLKLKITAEPATRAAAGETGIVETSDYRGEKVLAAYTHIPRTGWGFVAKRDLAEIYAPIYAMLWDMAFLRRCRNVGGLGAVEGHVPTRPRNQPDGPAPGCGRPESPLFRYGRGRGRRAGDIVQRNGRHAGLADGNSAGGRRSVRDDGGRGGR